MASLPPVFIEFLGRSDGVKRAMADIKRESKVTAEEGETSFGKFGRLGAAAVTGIGLAAAGAAVGAVKMAADFQTQMTRVRTGAGETAANMKMVSDGVLAMAGQVGQSTEQLTSGLYLVESAGYHGSAALTVLKNAAMGAKVGAADLGTTADAVTTAMNAYKMGANQSAQATNALIATEAEGKTNLEALAGSMSKILPTAAAAHVGLNEVLGAMATMTAQGTSADVAATYLRQTIGNLANPTGKAAQEMKSLGLDSVQVSQNLGKNGLASTLEMLTNAIQSKMGPAGTVLIEHLQKASKNANAFQKVLANLPPSQQTYIAALADMVGGTKSMMAALQLTGPHLKDFKDNTAGIAQHVKDGGNKIEGWSDVQKTLNQKLAEAKGALQAMTIQIGQALLPVATKIMGVIAETVTWLTKHKSIATGLAIVIGGVLVVALSAAAVAMWSFTAAALANPVVWIVAGIVALVAVIVALAMHWRQVWGAIKSVAEAVGHAVAAAWHWVASNTEKLWHTITHAVMTAWHAVAKFLSGAWHAVADPAVKAWHWVEDAATTVWHSIVQFFESAWHAVVDPIVKAWEWIRNVTAEVWDGIVGFFKKWWPLLLMIFAPFIGVIMAVWNHFHTAIFDGARTVWNAISGFFRTVWNGIKSIAATVWNAISSVVVGAAQVVWRGMVTIWNAITAALKAVWKVIQTVAGVAWAGIKLFIIQPMEDLWHALQQLWHTLSDWLTSAWHGIENVAGVVWSAIKTAIINPITSAWHTITSIVGKIGSALGDGIKGAWNTVSGWVDKFWDVGSNIVWGIIHGVENAAGSLFDSLKNLAGNALDAAKSFLGINSPSKVFADHVGMAIPEGIAKGVTDHAHLAHMAVGSLAGALSAQTVSVGTAGGGFGGGYGGGQYGGQPLVAEITVIAQVDKDVLFKANQRSTLQYNRRNLTNGLSLNRG